MQFFYNFSDALFAFMQRGGDVLYLIGLLAFVMWFLIFERMWYFFYTHKSHLGVSIDEWILPGGMNIDVTCPTNPMALGPSDGTISTASCTFYPTVT